MKFRFEDYQGDYVMLCKTNEEAKDFCRVMHESGRKWKSGKSYKINNWILYKEHMCYVFNVGEIQIFEYKGKEFTVSSLSGSYSVMYQDKVLVSNLSDLNEALDFIIDFCK